MSGYYVWTIRKGRDEGCGGFLNPPTHPAHTMSVVEKPRGNRRGDLRCIASLETAAEDPASIGCGAGIQARAARILAEWTPLPLEHPDVQAWILQVLGYFRDCYRNREAPEGKEWHADQLVIDRDGANTRPVEDHAGVHLIRKWYPAFTPTAEHWLAARWGS